MKNYINKLLIKFFWFVLKTVKDAKEPQKLT